MKLLLISISFLFLFSGGESNLHKRFRPSFGQKEKLIKYKEIDQQTRWFVEDVREWISSPDQFVDLYIFGSRAKDSWWFSSDFDFGIEGEVTPQIKATFERCKKKFKIPDNVKMEIRTVHPETDKDLIKVQMTTY